MRFHNITKDDMLNGDGLRVVLWVAGCEHRCKNCQNPITWDKNDGLEVTEDTIKELCIELDKEYVSGLTLSGGDPLATFNKDETTRIVKRIREEYGDTKSIWVYTGYNYEEIEELEIMEYIDVLVDGKFVETLKDVNTPWKGSTNQRVIDIKKTRETGKITVWA